MSVNKKILTLTLPLTVQMLCFSVIALTDAFFLSKLGIVALAVSALTVSLFAPFSGFLIALLNSTKILTAHAFGRKNFNSIREIQCAATVTGLLLSLVIVAMYYLMRPSLINVAPSHEVFEYFLPYLNVYIWSLIPASIYVAIRESQLGQGIVYPSMVIAIIGAITNAVMDWYFLRRGGYIGIAWATVCTYSFMAGSALFMEICRGNFITSQQLLKHCKEICKLGSIQGVKRTLEAFMYSLLIIFVGKFFGAKEIAALYILFQILAFASYPVIALADVLCVLAGNFVGSGMVKELFLLIKRGTFFAVVYYCCLYLVFRADSHWLLRSLFSENEALAVVFSVLALGVCYQMISSFESMVWGVLRGLAKLQIGLYALPVSYLVLFVSLFVALRVFMLSLDGVLISLIINRVIMGFLFYFGYKFHLRKLMNVSDLKCPTKI